MKRKILTLALLASTGCHSRHKDFEHFNDQSGNQEEKGKVAEEQKQQDQKLIADADGPTAKLVILETTDLHVNMEAFDYYKNAPTTELGFVRTASVIRQKRKEFANTVLVDNGDLIQGTPLGDWLYSERQTRTDPNTVYKALNLLNYDVANIGNHEFNYGLDYLQATLKGANFPYVSANTYVEDGDGDASNDKTLVKPYIIKDTHVITDDGQVETVKVGYIGFVPPQILTWDRNNLLNKLHSADIVDSAQKYIPRMKEDGAEIVVAIPHSGINSNPRQGNDENAVYYLSQVPGIDAILSGHSHQVFPSATYKNILNSDLTKGTINGIPTVMAGSWGSHLGQVTLNIKKVNGHWAVYDGAGTTIDVRKLDATLHEQDVRDAIKTDHEATLSYLQQEVGSTSQAINSYFSQLKPSTAVKVVNDAQLAYGKAQFPNEAVLSAFAPLKAGGTSNNYTEVAAGKLSRRSVSDLYVYPNTLMIVKISGAIVKEWLEMSASAFNQIVPNATAEQFLLRNDFPGYNFDVMAGLRYDIDVSQPPKYFPKGGVANAGAERVKNVTYLGKPLDLTQNFFVVTNNYRASGGGTFPGIDGKQIVHDSALESREILKRYVEKVGDITATRTSGADDNWSLLPVATVGPVLYKSGDRAQNFAADLGGLVTYVRTDADKFTYFKLNWPTIGR